MFSLIDNWSRIGHLLSTARYLHQSTQKNKNRLKTNLVNMRSHQIDMENHTWKEFKLSFYSDKNEKT